MATIWDTWAADPRYAGVVGDSRFLAATPAFKKSIHDILYKYGFTGTADQNAMAGGGAIEDNPYSVAAQLKKSLGESNHGTFNAANAAGLEESGAAVGALNANNENYKQGVSNAVAQEGGEISNALTDYTSQINPIFGDHELNPVVPAATPTPSIAPPPGAPSGVGTGTPTPQVPYQRTGPEAGSVALKVKKIKPVSYADALHGAGAF